MSDEEVPPSPSPDVPVVLVPYSKFQEIQKRRRPAAVDPPPPSPPPTSPADVSNRLESPRAVAMPTSRTFGIFIVED